LSNTFFKFV